MESVKAFLKLMLLSFLPARYRGASALTEVEALRWPTMLSGLLQASVCAGINFLRLVNTQQFRVGDLGQRVLDAGHDTALADQRLQFGMGFVSLMEFLIHPVSLILIYFMFEGLVRYVAALAAKQSVATLPLHLIAMVHGRFDKKGEARALGDRMIDLVEKGDGSEYALRISSSRPKPNWDRLMTIQYDEQLYEMTEHKEGKPPRRFVYLLRKMPAGKIVRGLHHYRRDEGLDQK